MNKDKNKTLKGGKQQLISLTGTTTSSQKQGDEMGRIPSLILGTIPKREPTLFTTEEEKERAEALSKLSNAFPFLEDSRRYDYSETQTLLALCFLCSNDEGEDIMPFIEATEREKIALSKYVERRIYLKDLSYFIFGDRKAVHVNSILKDIISLGSIPVKWILKDIINEEGKRVTEWKISPILNYEINFTTIDGHRLSKEEIFEQILKNGYIDVTFGRPFFQGISKRFGYISRRIITDWGTNGTRNDTFVRLSPMLLKLQWEKRKASIDAMKKAIAEAKKDKLSREQREALIEERVTTALTKDFRLSTINDLVKYDFFGNRQYGLLKEQVQAVIDYYKERGLLREGYFRGKGKNMKVYFVLNPDFGKKLLPETNEEETNEEDSSSPKETL